MFNFEANIGIEVHIVLNTLTKMFSPALNKHNSNPNTNLHFNDLGLPGTMPQPNKEAIKKALILAKALNMQNIDFLVRFDRKNYFYQDLPKGYQITQQYHPFAQNGYLEVEIEKEYKKYAIQRFHLEEDTAKQFSNSEGLYLDYNRAGAPLIEIVTDPIFKTSKDVKIFLNNLRQILIHNNISDAKMENGSMRVDINLSVRPIGNINLGTRVEIKNVNSINNIDQAINYEIDRQIQNLLSGHAIMQITMRYDENSQQTVFMREKTNAIDYRYMREPNIIQIQIDSNWVNDIYQKNPIIKPLDLSKKLIDFGIDKQHVTLFLDNVELLNAFNYINDRVNNPKDTSRWLLNEFVGILNRLEKTFDTNVTVKDLDSIVELIKLLNEEKINGKQAKIILEKAYQTKKTPNVLIVELGMEQITNPNELKTMLSIIIKENEAKIIKDYVNRPERIENMLLGLLMKKTNGQSNPIIATKVMRELLSNYEKK